MSTFETWAVYSLLQALTIFLLFKDNKKLQGNELQMVTFAVVFPIVVPLVYLYLWIKNKFFPKTNSTKKK